jgi:hypothetical protein
MKKIQNWDVGALVLWRVFGLIESSQTFWYENWQIFMNQSAFYFCGRWILITTVFHIPKSTSVGGIADFFCVWTQCQNLVGLPDLKLVSQIFQLMCLVSHLRKLHLGNSEVQFRFFSTLWNFPTEFHLNKSRNLKFKNIALVVIS